MDDGGSTVIGLIIFCVLLIMDGIFYGFLTALEEVTESQIQKHQEEGDKHAEWLLRVLDSPYKTRHTIQIMITFVSVVFGIYQVRLFGVLLIQKFIQEGAQIYWYFLCYAGAALIGIFIFTTVGVLAPQKIAARRPEKWLFRLAGLMHGIIVFLKPCSYLAEKVSNLVVRIFGIDPNASIDDVTEEEIISMVNEGHEQGALQASEAEMIHNIFEFDDKEAKDIMTHRKNIVAVDGTMSLSQVLEFMLDKNNSRFPVYGEDIDNIIGIIHIKDVMIQSRNERYKNWPVQDIPGLVREAVFIPETRNINELFKNMQSQKIHMVIVVDEYGQTAGLVAMEDILEEIVGNILDEYDEEENMIVEQPDGSFLMNGMAPFDEVCKTLELDMQEDEYETLNGYLIALIDKIPGDNEQFQVEDQGWQFHVIAVKNKMIQTVKVKKLEIANESETERDSADTCQNDEKVVK
ncbi:MAG: HlyC/CorC family transporter [Clostridiales bacterium]|nr:HlyC/CorC family transporter [Clostridiales bacterium]